MNHANPGRRVFFDLDGTLHRDDLFGCFLFWLVRHLPLNMPLALILLPVVASGLLICGRASRWPVSLLLWGMTLGRSHGRLQQLERDFADDFRQRMTPFPHVQAQLENWLQENDAEIWLITGSPEHLVRLVYADVPWFSSVRLIGSLMAPGKGGLLMTRRCLGQEKVAQLAQRIGTPLVLHSGYSDSDQDNPVLQHCQYRWRISREGTLTRQN